MECTASAVSLVNILHFRESDPLVGLALLDSPVGDADGASAHSWKLLALMMKRRWCGQAGLPALMKKTLPTQVLESSRVGIEREGNQRKLSTFKGSHTADRDVYSVLKGWSNKRGECHTI